MRPIVITGGPGAGKTTLIDELALQGYATFAEGSRLLIEQQSQQETPILPWTDLPQFATLCLALMQEQKRQAEYSAPAFVDRAIPDIIAYLQVGGCEVESTFFAESVGYHQQVFVCRPEASIYVQDEVRPHCFEEAMHIHQTLLEVYRTIGYQVIDVPWGSVAERTAFVLKMVRVACEG